MYREKYDRIAGFYELLERPLDRFFNPLRESAVSLAEGKTLEIGVGTGKTLRYYPQDVELYAIDGSEKMLEMAKKRAKELGMDVKFKVAEAESLPFPDDFFDTVVSSFVFCTVPEPERAIEEIKRVLKPDGMAIFLEHTKSESELVNYLFLLPMKLILKPLLDDDPLRDTHKLVRKHFKVEKEEAYYSGVVRLIVAKNDKD
ncbi:SAM-dependent methyltransferase, UbiE/COQ5 family [Thermococcus kodakarensis KOD1]|uniref:SAM-dependent methyltransferase, UbiE/COQ5 family n=1 Tax=Thermococcus kodakarensis (strain ATCC BAA-918 / JCM 12380 / KOD1) TaxID=69014 RepID=Q5JG68_THEKO|nr:class I SAM-dependent methyltransferase [Thermococcus kodakarensis]WCN28756.1 class I SAM-dependent methyltransferase [Thermococcus kodakarensis]WCN31054.1 class I SAM-dependent methyltransferase [Thermococcus kodakarensis]BAD84918.1 SAM-dependent methyltransferase, UbiE/COQ5 family [Thermococcus kodakarensis KOD1]